MRWMGNTTCHQEQKQAQKIILFPPLKYKQHHHDTRISGRNSLPGRNTHTRLLRHRTMVEKENQIGIDDGKHSDPPNCLFSYAILANNDTFVNKPGGFLGWQISCSKAPRTR
jgi:hypothetical protein